MEADNVVHRGTISFESIGKTARYGLRILDEKAEDLVRPLLFDTRPNKLSDTMVAAAGLTWLGKETGIAIQLKGDISSTLLDDWRRTLDIEIQAKEADEEFILENPFTSLQVSTGLKLAELTPGRDETRLNLLPSERFSGSLRGIKELVVASNAWMFAGDRRARALAAAGLIFAEDLMVEHICFDSMSAAIEVDLDAIFAPLGIDLGVRNPEITDSVTITRT